MGERRGWVVPLLAALVVCTHAQAGEAANDARLARAIRANDTAGAQFALARKANPNRRLAFGATPLGWAVNTQNPAMVALLLEKGATPNTADLDGVTPLALACELGDAKIVGMLLSAHADAKAHAPDGATPLARCARYGPPDAIARMLRSGAAADSLDSRGQTPLMWAAASGRVEAMAMLIKAGADVTRVSKGGFTPLFFAIKSGVLQATEVLLAAGARRDWRGPENTSAAQLAMYQNNFAAAAVFVERGADVSERDRTGRQLLHAAAAAGDAALVRLLLAKGADPDGLTGPSRITWVTEANFGVAPAPVPPTPPLLIAAANGHEAVMRLLPPLRVLVGGGDQPQLASMMRILAAHGARTDIKDKSGATPAKMADEGLSEVKAIFLQNFPEPAVATVAVAAAPTKATSDRPH